jgi:hypothetical protein
MAKWMWILAVGAVATYFVHRTNKSYAMIVAGITAVAAFIFWKKG